LERGKKGLEKRNPPGRNPGKLEKGTPWETPNSYPLPNSNSGEPPGKSKKLRKPGLDPGTLPLFAQKRKPLPEILVEWNLNQKGLKLGVGIPNGNPVNPEKPGSSGKSCRIKF